MRTVGVKDFVEIRKSARMLAQMQRGSILFSPSSNSVPPFLPAEMYCKIVNSAEYILDDHTVRETAHAYFGRPSLRGVKRSAENVGSAGDQHKRLCYR